MSAPTREEPTTRALPRRASWQDSVTRWSLAVLLATGLSALLLAMIGLLNPWLAIPSAAAIALAVERHLPPKLGTATSNIVGAWLLILVLGLVGVGLAAPHEHILTTRDSGTYVATAAWLVENGGLHMDVADPIFEDTPVVYGSVGFPTGRSNSNLQAQFLHMFPSLLALVGSLGLGLPAMYWLNPLIAGIGLFAMFAFARSLLSERLALFATALTGLTMPFLYFFRAPFSEPLTFAFLFGGLWVSSEALRIRSMRLATGAGLLLGGVMLTRIDGAVVLLGFVVYRTFLHFEVSDREPGDGMPPDRILDRVIGVATVFFVAALVDLGLFSLQYLVDHGDLIAGVVASILAATLVGRFGVRRSALFARSREAVAIVIPGLIGAYLTYAWLVRPFVEAPTRSDIYGIAGLQEAADVAIEPLRSYGELSVHWLSWYLGAPLVAAGVLALVIGVRRTILGHKPVPGPFVSVTAVLILLYVYRPSINPDHIWAMRRFLPLVIPALIILALAIAQEAVPRLGRWEKLAAIVLAAAFAIPVTITTVRSGLQPEFEGGSHDLVTACEQLGPESALLFTGDGSQVRKDALAPVLRGFCGIGVASEDPDSPLTDADMAIMVDRAATAGRTLWIVEGGSERPEDSSVIMDRSYEFLELTLFEAPSRWLTLDLRLMARDAR